jgi:hypothetical protein
MKQVLMMVISISTVLMMPSAPSAACTVCHSKNPRMVAMHRQLGFKDCFTCHGRGLATTAEEKQTQMLSDNRCSGCHKK